MLAQWLKASCCGAKPIATAALGQTQKFSVFKRRLDCPNERTSSARPVTSEMCQCGTPMNRPRHRPSACLKGAINGPMHRSEKPLHSITSSARASTVPGTVRPARHRWRLGPPRSSSPNDGADVNMRPHQRRIGPIIGAREGHGNSSPPMNSHPIGQSSMTTSHPCHVSFRPEIRTPIEDFGKRERRCNTMMQLFIDEAEKRARADG
jgi:hypothetical protein